MEEKAMGNSLRAVGSPVIWIADRPQVGGDRSLT
jgi:hypothetical protein